MKILTVVVPIVVHEGKVLMLKRIKPPYAGYWSLLGGKIDFGEHPEQSAVREIREEAGIETELVKFRGILSEVVKDKATMENVEHFILFVSEMRPKTLDIKSSEEGELKWFDIATLEQNKGIAPSDIEIVRKILQKEEGIPVHKSDVLKDGLAYYCEAFGK